MAREHVSCLTATVALLASLSTPAAPAAQATQAPAPNSFDLFFLGHQIGVETDTVIPRGDGREIRSTFHFEDRGTAIDLTAALNLEWDGSPNHLLVKGRNYRLFTSDSEVTIANGRAHVRDLTAERDVDVAGRPFFPIDNYAPIGVQEALIQYWLSHGRPAEIQAPPAGVVRIASRGRDVVAGPTFRLGNTVGIRLERLSIDGVVWGRETAWVLPVPQRTGQAAGTPLGRLAALTTWAGALPFEAIAGKWRWQEQRTLIPRAAADRVDDLTQVTKAIPPLYAGTYALTNATIVDGTDRPPTLGTVLIRDGRILAVGPTVNIPGGAPTVDLTGATIIAGLWDMHAHASQVDWAPVYLASGVTTIRDMGGEEAFLVAIRNAIASGRAMGPRYLLAGLIDGPGPRAFGMVTAATPAEAIAIVRRYHAEHFQEIKIYSELAPALVPVVTAEAHRLGMTVTGHVPAGMTSQSVVDAGYDGIAHMQLRGESGSDPSKQQLAFFKAHGTVMDPTASWNELSAHSATYPIARFLPEITRLPAPLARMFASMPDRDGGTGPQTNSLKLLKDAVEAGLLVVAGTDKGVPGLSLQREIELYVDGGMTPLQAIQAATIMPARAMKLDKELGTVEAGKRADLVVLDRNPLDAIGNVRSARYVITNGRLYDCNTLWTAAGYSPRRRSPRPGS